MATIKMTKKNSSYMCEVKSDSQSNVYIPVESVLKTTTAVDFDLSASTKDLFVRNGNDLTILSIFSSGQIVTNTVKNYFKLAQKYPFVWISQTGNFYDDTDTYDYNWVLNNLSGADTVYGSIVDSGISVEYLLGTSKGDSYKISNGTTDNVNLMDYVYDFAGNDNYLISAKHLVSQPANWVEIKDYKGNDNYNLENTTYSKIYDDAGNDVYSSKETSRVNVEDKAGKDTYNFYDGTRYVVTDLAGNDTYNVYNAGAGDIYNSNITDEKGNDNYNIVKANAATITDKGGNDKYVLTSGSSVKINETAGKDTYTLTAEKYDEINDNAGNDKYTVSASDYIKITDLAGKDNYNIAYTTDLDLQDGLSGETKSGNDTYNLSYISQKDITYSQVTDFAGNDKYNMSFSEHLHIIDYKGSDSYVVKDSTLDMKIFDYGKAEKVGKKMNNKLANDKYTLINSDVTITDSDGADTYKLTNTNASIYDNGGSDKYNVTGVRGHVDITDNTASNDTYNLTNTYTHVYDKGGKDTYNITSSYAEIKDYSSDKDTYNVKDMKGSVIINDLGGTGDTVKLSANKNNLVFMANYNTKTPTQKNDVADGSLFIFDKTTNGFVKIENYFDTKYSSYNYYLDGHGDGYIESIKAGKATMNSAIDAYATPISGGVKADELGAAVAGWLEDNGYSTDVYDSIATILNSDIANQFIAAVVAQQ